MDDAGSGAPITDPLTGAYSRALLGPRLDEELSRAARSSTGCALFVFDVDYFKSVNDAYGHPRGDAVLCGIVERVGALIRGYDVLFRYGGDEFVLLLPDTAKPDAVAVGLRLAEGIRATPFPGDPPLNVSVSIGVASFPDDALDAEGLLACADRRNYLAKSRGRACAVADDVETEARPVSSRLLERDIALSAVREFMTHLQAKRRGALRITGEPGAGYSRFLEEAVRTARLRGFEVITVTAAGATTTAAGTNGVVLVADRDAGAAVTAAIDEMTARQPAPPLLGLIYAAASPAEEPTGLDTPLLDTVELLAWSQAALRVWLRTTLQGEPSPVLLDWLVSRSSGLPARAERELNRLSSRNGLLRNESGAWTVAPALLARSTRNQRLPVPLTEFVGRQNETAQVAQLLADRRLVTLVGPGGIGKSRLALAVAAAIADGFDDGAAFVPLADIDTTELVAAALAQALEITEVPGQTLTATVFEQLADRATLLVLDNFEHVLDAAPIISELLAAAPRVRVLVSSRERLDLYGEQVYRVPPLPLPELGALRRNPEGVALALAGSPALALFNTRARAAAYDFAVTSDNITAVVELCHRLDGLPLAIELAAARCDEMSPAEMLSQLGPQLDLSGPRDAPGRQRTLRGAIDWSFALLDAEDQDLFVRLGAFAGGCRAEAVAALYPPEAALDNLAKRLAGLADKSLVLAEPEDDDGARYVLLETMRAYVVERIEQGSDAETLRHRHAEHFAAFAERAGHELTGPRQARWAGRIEKEYQNLRTAFGGSVGREAEATEAAPAARIVLGLWRFWRTGSHIGEGRDWLDRVLATGLAQRPRAQVLHAAAVLAAAQDDHATAHALATESLDRARGCGDAQTTAQASNALGIAALAAGDYPAARGFFTESLSIWQRQDQPFGMAIAHGNLTKVALRTGEIDAASGHAAQCLELERRQGNTRGIMLGLLCVGEIMLVRGDATAARDHLEEGLSLSRTLGDVFGEAMALHQLGLLALREGSLAEATRLVGAALALRHEVGDREDLACSLDTLAGLLAGVDPEVAARMLGAADALRARHRLPLPAEGRDERDATLAQLKSTLDAERFTAAWTTGQSVSLDVTIDEAADRVAVVAQRGG